MQIRGARENNLKSVDVDIPLGTFVCVTGVSGSGKSSLIREVLYKSLAQALHERGTSGEHERVDGLENLDKVIDIDRSPIGRTPRSNGHLHGAVHADSRAVRPGTRVARPRVSAWALLVQRQGPGAARRARGTGS